ncbi:MAG: ABC transporter permease [Anaerolineales bacterium]|nr:ABC transporter permease [Anaerolineales bacterium]
MPKLVKLAWRNVWRNWRRTGIAMIAIVLALFLLIFMDGLYGGYDEAVFANAVRLYGGNLQIHAPGFRERAHRLPLLPLADADRVVETVMAHPEVLLASKRIRTSGMINEDGDLYPVTITGLEPSIESPYSLISENITAGRFLEDDDEDMILIGERMAEELGVGVGNRITLVGKSKNQSLRQRTMTIVGLFNLGMPDAEKKFVFINLAEAGSLYNLRGQATEVAVNLHIVGNEDQMISEFRPILPGYEVDSWLTLNPEFAQIMDLSVAATTFFGFIVIAMACIGILNIMLMAVYERTREMGVLAALGMKGRQVMGLFLLEGAMIGAVGAFGGCTLGWLAMLAFNMSGGYDISSFTSAGEIYALMGNAFYAAINPASIIQIGLLLVLMAVLASLLPAWQASQKEPAESLHHV